MSKNFLQGSSSDLLGAMTDMNRKMEEEAVSEKAKKLQIPYVSLRNFPIDLIVLAILSEEEAKEAGAVTFFRENTDLRIAVIDPSNALLQKKLEELSKEYKISLYLVSKSSLNDAIRFYAKVMTPKLQKGEVIVADDKTDYEAVLNLLKEEVAQKKKNSTDLISDMFGIAMFFKASDIHFEPEEHIVKVRFRVDGVLQDLLHFSKDLQKSLVTRIKIVSHLKINVENLPQDGRITFYWGKEPIDVRVSSLPSAYGEGVVMRLLATTATSLKLDDLGFRGKAYEIIEQEIQKPNGFIVTTGPTGSGKTTTLYAFLNQLNEPGVKIITIEDPVEYKLEGVSQTPIDHNVDFSFAKALRAILRQDPDIVMVGEIRDQETAETALQAALTGHVVLSTLHTNDASGAIPRLLTMGAKPYIISPALNAVIAQRLVRRLCVACKTPAEISPTMLERISHILKDISPASETKVPEKLQFFHSPGCKECHNLGYKGRMGIYEVIQVNSAVKEMVLKEASMGDIKKQAVSDGMVTMVQDGLLKALEGITDIEEVFRVAGE